MAISEGIALATLFVDIGIFVILVMEFQYDKIQYEKKRYQKRNKKVDFYYLTVGEHK